MKTQKIEMKHTAGPWRLDNIAANGEQEIGISRSWEIGGSSICTVDSSRDSRRLLADARLIASAPDLLAALQSLIGLIDDKVQSEGSTLSGPTNYEAAYDERNATRWICRARELIANAGSAIATATGEEKP